MGGRSWLHNLRRVKIDIAQLWWESSVKHNCENFEQLWGPIWFKVPRTSHFLLFVSLILLEMMDDWMQNRFV